ncbi:MAG: TerB family tellurite resistance protein [Flavobacteriaceae bacterium]|nr:TerB family tellurite resistance protein [Flavobacteriaceae bacterium]
MDINKWIGSDLGFSLYGYIGEVLKKSFNNIACNLKDTFRSTDNVKTNMSAGDFQISLLILSSFVVKADNKIDERELKFVNSYFVKLYGVQRSNNIFILFNKIHEDRHISYIAICKQIRIETNYQYRIQLLHYLFSIAKSDDLVSIEEIYLLRQMSFYLGLNSSSFESMKSMFLVGNSSYMYKVLGVESSSSNIQIKKAYREMIKKHHPDKFQYLGDEYAEGVKNKFIKIQNAYETIKKERNI